MNKLLFLLLIINSSLLFAQQGWQQVAVPEAGYRLYGIYFIDVNTGLVDVFKTTNGGQNWTMPTTIGGGYTMMFVNQSTGFISGGSRVYKTTNLGNNWTSTVTTTGNLYGVHFADINNGFACGDNSNIVKTTNSGVNWTELTTALPDYYDLTGTFMVNANTIYICGYSGANGFISVILKSTDGGANWNIQNFPPGTAYGPVFFINSNTGIVVGEKIIKTTDAGATWVEKDMPAGIFCYGLYFPSPSIGYAVGNGGIMKTTDGGETWFEQSTQGGLLESIYFINDNTGYACGDNGVVLKTTDGGGPPFGIQQIGTEVPQNYSLLQNYPNPFNPTTNIKFSVPKKSFVKIIIYDALGRKIDELVNDELNAGTYKVDWQAHNFASGVYYYSLCAGDFKKTRKLVLLK